ncbi:hypothetical protein MUP06_00980 [Patescibacteria group bacterium]|nr:hypothetical protein [Patescibacteria group bacterium]
MKLKTFFAVWDISANWQSLLTHTAKKAFKVSLPFPSGRGNDASLRNSVEFQRSGEVERVLFVFSLTLFATFSLSSFFLLQNSQFSTGFTHPFDKEQKS